MKINRYPGVKPFSADEQAIFFGRDRDIADLCDLIRVEKTCVLFGKSGYGKSSLLQAGVLPRLATEYLPVEVRFGEYIAGQSLPPLENLRLALAKRTRPNPQADFMKDLPDSLWVSFKQVEVVPPLQVAERLSSSGFLLVFDQFEEFFSYSPEQQRIFREQLAELLHEELPENLRDAARELPREQRRLLAQAPDVRLVVALRSDRLHELDRMKDHLPTLLHKRYELRALSREQAREAVLGPASLADARFASPPFSYSDPARQQILADLSRSNTAQQAAGIEAFQLQILCDSIESRVASGLVPDRDGDGLPDVMPEDLPDFSEVFGQYYERRLAHLPEREQAVARRVVEDGLVRLDPATGEGRRLSVDGDALLQQFGHQGLVPELLRALEATFLLRREPNSLGGYNYELSHDTLLTPITAAAKERRQREEEERLRQEAERQIAEQRKIERARRRNLLVGLGALALLFFAFLKTYEAARAQEKAQAMTALANEQSALALKKDSEAQHNTARADKLLQEVEQATANIEKAKKALLLAQNATEEQKQIAQKNFAEAEQAGYKVIELLLDNARQQILKLDYLAARHTLVGAVRLARSYSANTFLGHHMRPAVALTLMEPAFFFVETNQWGEARSALMDMAELLDKPLPSRRDTIWWTAKTNAESHKQFTKMLRELHPDSYDFFYRRYYGEFAPIPGGTDTIGDDDYRRLTVTVSPFSMAKTETTWWQYNLFCTATHYPLPEIPGWGAAGDNPVVEVSWFDAVVYANWCSQRVGLNAVYDIDSTGKKQYDWNVKADFGKNGYRLPTESEWEYAARAGTEFEYAGDSILANVGWCNENSGSRTHAVAQKETNAFGLYDMSGNVWEWCWDWGDIYPKEPVKDYRGAEEGAGRVLRGGSWHLNTHSCRAAARYYVEPDYRLNTFGFRLALCPQ